MGDPWVPRDKVSATTTKASICVLQVLEASIRS